MKTVVAEIDLQEFSSELLHKLYRDMIRRAKAKEPLTEYDPYILAGVEAALSELFMKATGCSDAEADSIVFDLDADAKIQMYKELAHERHERKEAKE